MKNMQKGFTLIELMIVVAIIGILAAIALPAYQDYTARSQVSEALTLASGGKVAVSEFWADRGYFPPHNESAGLAADTSISGNYVAQVGTGTSGDNTTPGQITATMKTSGVASGVQGFKLTLSAVTTAGSVEWRCFEQSKDTTKNKYVPQTCRS